jgi:GT2 family glycosyltransferase
MRISVIVPTVERVEALRNCLNCLLAQKYPLFEIIVVYYEKDLPTVEVLKEFPTIKKVKVSVLGHARANNAGKKAATGDILSFIDDDTRPSDMWSQKIADYFVKMPQLQGLGGRDRIFLRDGRILDYPEKYEVGVVKWYGKLIGNHHLGRGEPRSVDILKGCQMIFRSNFVCDLDFEDRLLGNASQICNDMDFSLQVRKKGGLIIYDPQLVIEHHVQKRISSDFDTRAFSYLANRNIVHNTFFSIKKNIGFSMFLRVFAYSVFSDLMRIHKPNWMKRIYADIWAFGVVAFQKSDDEKN